MIKQALNHPHIPHEVLNHIRAWIEDATKTEANDPTATCLSTIGSDGFPDSRMVLVRIIDENGFVFFTNRNSKKGQDLLKTPQAALCFHWKTQRRQLRVQGLVTQASDHESDDYYHSRARESRIGAWASSQSDLLTDRTELMSAYEHYNQKFNGIENPPRPPHWGGFRIHPRRIEFWQDGDHRLHDRDVYSFENGTWNKVKLYP